MVIAQIDRERTIHLLVNKQHNDVGDDERHEGSVTCHESIACDCVQEGLAFFMSVSFRLGFGDCPINNHGHKTADDRINDKQIEEIDVCQESANGWADDPCQVPDHAQNTGPFLSLFFGQDICNHGFLRGTRNTRKQTHHDHKGKQDREIVDEAESKRTDSTEYQTKQDQLFPAEFIGQRAADHAPDQTKQ